MRARRLFGTPWSCFGKPAERASSSKGLLVCTAENYEEEAARKDRLVILSDGLASPAPGENPTESLARLRKFCVGLREPGHLAPGFTQRPSVA